MREIVCTELGPLDNLELRERDTPEPGPREVRVSTKAAGVNFADALMVTGRYQIRPPAPFVPGSEVSGTVDAVGADVTDLRAGDRVLAMCWLGGFADHAIVSRDVVVELPDGVDFDRAACIVQSYSTSMFALDRRASLAEGETVLVLGAGGGVGLAAVDIAAALGARVIAAASTPDKQARAAAAGADATIGYDGLKDHVRELTGGEGADITYDAIGGEMAEQGLRALRDFGRFLVVGFASGDIEALPANQILLRNRSVIGVDWGAWMRTNVAEHMDLIRRILELTTAGRLSPVEPTRRNLDEAGAVLQDFLDRRIVGKVVLTPGAAA